MPRTLLDQAAAARNVSQVERQIQQAEKRGLFDLKAVEELLAGAGGHRGRWRLERALSIYREPTAFTRSGLEERFLEVAAAAGLPKPASNIFVGGYELDAFWPEERFAVELDVYETHGGRASFERDRLRQEDLKLRGIEMVRVTGHRLEREPGAVIARLDDLLRQRRRQLGLE